MMLKAPSSSIRSTNSNTNTTSNNKSLVVTRSFSNSSSSLNSFGIKQNVSGLQQLVSKSFSLNSIALSLPSIAPILSTKFTGITSFSLPFGPLFGASQQRDYAIRRRRLRRKVKKPFDPSKSKEVTWKEYTDRLQTVPYVAMGGERYGIPKCRGCDKRLHKDELRIQCVGIFLPQPWQRTYQAIKGLSSKPQKPGFPTKYTFCSNVACIEKAIADKDNKPDYRISYPIFDGRVGITEELKEKAGPPPPGISWLDVASGQSSSSSMSSSTTQQEARM